MANPPPSLRCLPMYGQNHPTLNLFSAWASPDGAHFGVARRGVNFNHEKVLPNCDGSGAEFHHHSVGVAAVVELAARQIAACHLFVQFHILWKYEHKK